MGAIFSKLVVLPISFYDLISSIIHNPIFSKVTSLNFLLPTIVLLSLISLYHLYGPDPFLIYVEVPTMVMLLGSLCLATMLCILVPQTNPLDDKFKEALKSQVGSKSLEKIESPTQTKQESPTQAKQVRAILKSQAIIKDMIIPAGGLVTAFICKGVEEKRIQLRRALAPFCDDLFALSRALDYALQCKNRNINQKIAESVSSCFLFHLGRFLLATSKKGEKHGKDFPLKFLNILRESVFEIKDSLASLPNEKGNDAFYLPYDIQDSILVFLQCFCPKTSITFKVFLLDVGLRALTDGPKPLLGVNVQVQIREKVEAVFNDLVESFQEKSSSYHRLECLKVKVDALCRILAVPVLDSGVKTPGFAMKIKSYFGKMFSFDFKNSTVEEDAARPGDSTALGDSTVNL